MMGKSSLTIAKEYLKKTIKELEEEYSNSANPDDIWDEVGNAIQIKLDAYRDILKYIESES